jgi:hypothetical protein
MTETPPSIPIDSTIRAGPLVMEEIGMNPHAGLFGESELAIIWEKVCSTMIAMHKSSNMLTGRYIQAT